MRDDGQPDASDASGAPDVPIGRLRRPRPRREGPRPRTLDARELATAADDGGYEVHPLELAALQDARPRTRGDCANGERPCPFVGCRHHLYLEVDRESGHVKLNFPDVEPWDLSDTCSLDVAERDGITLEETGELLNVTRERVRQLEEQAIAKLKKIGHRLQSGLPIPAVETSRARSTGRHCGPEVRAQIAADLIAGGSNGVLALRHQVSKSLVSLIRGELGLAKKRRGRSAELADRDARIVAAMAGGGDRREVATAFNVSPDVVSQVCFRARQGAP